ncbi:hypothetical protein TNCV_4980901 [Trichonephila clavipes]|nr:hypothetical protein TNCV_4980901 [Trichonephila clavipes]
MSHRKCGIKQWDQKSATIRGALAFIPRWFAPVFWIGFFTVIQSVFLIGLESAEGYPLPVNDIPQAREIPQNTPYHDVFMSAMPSSRRGNTSPFSVGIQLSPHQKKCWASDPEEKKFRKIKLSPHRKKHVGHHGPHAF